MYTKTHYYREFEGLHSKVNGDFRHVQNMGPYLANSLLKPWMCQYGTNGEMMSHTEYTNKVMLNKIDPKTMQPIPPLWHVSVSDNYHAPIPDIPSVDDVPSYTSEMIRLAINLYMTQILLHKKKIRFQWITDYKCQFPNISSSPTQYEMDAHSQYLSQSLELNELALSDVPVPAAGYCAIIAAERAHYNDPSRDGTELCNQLIALLNPGYQESVRYQEIYCQYYGSMEQYTQDYMTFANGSESFWNTPLFDLLPFIMSDVLERPIVIFNSYYNSAATLIVGPITRTAHHINSTPIILARNAALNHYENVRSISVPNSSNNHYASLPKTKYVETHPPKKKQKMISALNHKIGTGITGIQFCQQKNLSHSHRFENTAFLFVLLIIVLSSMDWTNIGDATLYSFIKYAMFVAIEKRFPFEKKVFDGLSRKAKNWKCPKRGCDSTSIVKCSTNPKYRRCSKCGNMIRIVD